MNTQLGSGPSTWQRDDATGLLLVVVTFVLANFVVLSWRQIVLDKGVLIAIALVTLMLVVAVLRTVRWRIDDERRRLDDLVRRVEDLENQARRRQ